MSSGIPAPVALVVMGVSGSGKPTLAELLARALGVDYVGADGLHPETMTAEMAGDAPLTDEHQRGDPPLRRRLGRRVAGGSQYADRMQPLAIVVMGVSGCGKSTVGDLLAHELKVDFVDADDLHPAENKAKMAAGTPLVDEDRWPWLAKVGAAMKDETDDGNSIVVACSALRRVYRDALRHAAAGPVFFVHLHGTKELLAERLGHREGHFMPTTLLDSQLDTLEPLQQDEQGVVLDIALTPEQLAQAAIAALPPVR